jgi:hypothetical protein
MEQWLGAETTRAGGGSGAHHHHGGGGGLGMSGLDGGNHGGRGGALRQRAARKDTMHVAADSEVR